MVGDGPEREHVYLLARRAALGHRLGGHVDPRALLDERVEPARPHRGRPGRPRVGRVARPRLPVEDLHPRLRRLGVDDQDALRRQRPVDQALRMREVHRLGDLAEQVQPGVDVEARAALGQPVVEAPRALAVLEDERRPAHVLGVRLGREDALVPHVAQNLILAPGRPLQRRPLVVRRGGGDRVDADPRALAVDGRVARRPVLVARPFEEERVEPVVAHAARALRRADARLLHGAADRLGHRPVDARARRRAGAVPGERGDDAGALVPSRPRVAAVHVAAQVLGEPAVDVLVRQEDVSLQERARPLRPQRALAAQERDQLLRLAVREQQRVVDRLPAPVAAPRPRALVALHDAGPALDLDEVEALRRQREQVDLVDRAVVGDELEVRPGPVRLVVGQPVAHERQRVPLPGERRVGDRLPAGRGCVHGLMCAGCRDASRTARHDEF